MNKLLLIARKHLFILFLAHSLLGLSQTTTEKYSRYYDRYEYFNEDNELIGYKKWNKYYKQWEYTEVNPNKNDYEYVQPIDLELVNQVLAQKQRVYEQRESIALETMKTVIHQLAAYYNGSPNLNKADEYFSTFLFSRMERFLDSKGRYDFSNNRVYQGWINTLKEAYVSTLNNVPIQNNKVNSLKPKIEAKAKLKISETDVEQRKFIDSIRKKASKVVKEIESSEKNDEPDFNILNLEYLKAFDGEYKFEEIASSEPLSNEIKKLYGEELFEEFMNNIDVQSPIRILDNELMVTANKAHMGAVSQSSLYINFDNNLIFVGILDDDKVHIRSNASRDEIKRMGAFPQKFKVWTDDAFRLEKINSN